MMNEKYFTFICYIIECLLGTLIGYYLYNLHHSFGAWCLFSIILVISPDRKDGLVLAMNRIKANLIGASIGLILYWIHSINILTISIGIVATLLVCQLLKLEAVNRTAMIAVLIITTHEPGQHFWDVALERAGGVVSGCLIAVALTYVFHLFIQKTKRFFVLENNGSSVD